MERSPVVFAKSASIILVNQLFSKLCFTREKRVAFHGKNINHLTLKKYPLPNSNSVNKYSLCVEGKFQSEAYELLKLI